ARAGAAGHPYRPLRDRRGDPQSRPHGAAGPPRQHARSRRDRRILSAPVAAAALGLDVGSRIAALGRALLTQRRAAFQVWGAFALVMILVSAPLFSTVLPPLFDYPNHLARMHVLSEGGNQFYAVHWEPVPNLAQDLIVPPLARLIPLDIASTLFLVAIFGLITGATIWLNRV